MKGEPAPEGGGSGSAAARTGKDPGVKLVPAELGPCARPALTRCTAPVTAAGVPRGPLGVRTPSSLHCPQELTDPNPFLPLTHTFSISPTPPNLHLSPLHLPTGTHTPSQPLQHLAHPQPRAHPGGVRGTPLIPPKPGSWQPQHPHSLLHQPSPHQDFGGPAGNSPPIPALVPPQPLCKSLAGASLRLFAQ